MSGQTMKKHRGNLSTYYCVKEACLERLQIVWFQQYDVLERAKLQRQQDLACQELGINRQSPEDF